MVMAWQSINDKATKRNWDLFYEAFLDKKIPIIICITGRGIESSGDDQIWIDAQKNTFNKLGFSAGKPHKCVVYSRPLNEVDISFKDLYHKLRVRSLGFLKSLLDANITNEFFNPVGQIGLYDTMKMVINTFLKMIGMNNWMFHIREGFIELLIRLGFSEHDANELSRETL